MPTANYRDGVINRVILASDGIANVGNTDPNILAQYAQDYYGRSIFLSTVGVGRGNYNDQLLEQLADKGNGTYSFLDSTQAAERIFAQDLTGTLQTIAKDAKIQVDFNPNVVRRYRLIGYENRAVADQDFRNIAVDAGEVGAGHNVTALYEVEFKPEANADALIAREQDLGEQEQPLAELRAGVVAVGMRSFICKDSHDVQEPRSHRGHGERLHA